MSEPVSVYRVDLGIVGNSHRWEVRRVDDDSVIGYDDESIDVTD
jgi:hypothetical protein